ncbi:MAG: polyprenyl synthetase family protein [Bifidobacteriaceae bacterium]|jgi:heptaprenyl diphosphate synthase|nr:polyprenyl synthetase family protein [Bifidobacteriaceae bacterium]
MAVELALTLADPALDAALRQGMAEVEVRLAAATAVDEPWVAAAASHLLRAGGKRLRPMLTLLASHLGDGINDAVIDAAATVELIHLASLYHDDVMDDAPLRRGAPSAHEVYGPTVAILTGDLLFAKASQMVSGLGGAIVRIQAETFERLCLGQIHETTGPGEGVDPVAFHLDVLAHKTGALIATSARFGAMLGGAAPDIIEAVAAYGEAVGVAFQLADDIIDLASQSAVTGKTPGTDLREGVPTMPGLLVAAAARADLARGVEDSENVALARAISGDLSSDAVLADVVERLRRNPALEESRAVARAWAARATAHLASLPPGPIKDAFLEVATLFVHRLA